MRRTFTISILLFSLLSPGWLAYVFFQHQKYQVREAVKERLLAGADPAELVEWTFAKADVDRLLKWEHEREFEFQGQMYDVVEAIPEGDSIRYRCWWDRAETELNRRLDRLVAFSLGHDPVQQQNQAQLSSFFKSLFCIHNLFWTVPHRAPARGAYAYLAAGSLPAGPPPIPPPES